VPASNWIRSVNWLGNNSISAPGNDKPHGPLQNLAAKRYIESVTARPG